MTPPVVGSPAARFAAVGVLGTAAYRGCYLVLRPALGAAPANVAARTGVACVTTWAGTTLAFGVRVPLRHLIAATGTTVAASSVLSTTALALLAVVDAAATRSGEIVVLVAVNATMTGVRFVALRLLCTRRVARAVLP